ncbi:MAG: hypothetical protein IT450_11510 [Phycisphaerales bacterium]|nr:hypothetical protein [Phycisphaerales bacterium]
MWNVRERVRAILAFAGLFAACGSAQVTFSDDFDDPAGASVLWGDERGAWAVAGGTYGATQPSNNPITLTSLPFALADLEFECDIVATDDGGIWLHVDAAGQNGILLVLARGNMYWHPIVGGNVTGTLNLVSGVYTVGQNVHVRATVSGDLYSAYVNGNLITTLTNSSFPTGRVGLYDFRAPNHNYDNVVLAGQCAAGEDCCPRIARSPLSTQTCPDGPAVFSFAGAGESPMTTAWQFESDGGPVAVSEGENADAATGLQFHAAGAATDTLTVTNIRLGNHPNVISFVGAVTRDGCGVALSAPATLTICDHPGDVDCNGRVNLSDLTVLLASFGRTDDPGRSDGNLDGDGDVDLSDLAQLLGDFGSDCP